jgi:hypothetical protein
MNLHAVSSFIFYRKIRLGHTGLDPVSSKKGNDFNWILNQVQNDEVLYIDKNAIYHHFF